MGRAKDMISDEQERGWSSIGTFVCDMCFGDYAIKELIREQAVESKCDYCGRHSRKKPIAADMDSVMEVIASGVYYEWEEANQWGGYDRETDGWPFLTRDTYDLVWDELELGIESDKLGQDIIESLNMKIWCPVDPYGMTPDEEWGYSWRYFVDLVKHKVRYFFHDINVASGLNPYEPYQYPATILSSLADIVTELGMFLTVRPGHVYYRGRLHDEGVAYTTSEDLGPPPEDKANFPNRMSAAGIPMFYGADDEETAIAEVARTSDGQLMSIGKFQVLREMTVLDLTQIPPMPSLFDSNRWNLRSPIAFIHDFTADLSKPIHKSDGREHVEYVPTQVVTEYFRHQFALPDGRKLDGILYPCSCRQNATSCVLFLTQNECTDDPHDAKLYKKVLLMESVEEVTIG